MTWTPMLTCLLDGPPVSNHVSVFVAALLSPSLVGSQPLGLMLEQLLRRLRLAGQRAEQRASVAGDAVQLQHLLALPPQFVHTRVLPQPVGPHRTRYVNDCGSVSKASRTQRR